jgi:hypothetical protein
MQTVQKIIERQNINTVKVVSPLAGINTRHLSYVALIFSWPLSERMDRSHFLSQFSANFISKHTIWALDLRRRLMGIFSCCRYTTVL